MDYSVGDLAKRCGLTVRALHHYEKLGLLKPTGRTEAGYRQYGEADVLRLHRLMALRQSGLALKEVGALLDAEHPPLREVLARQIEALEQQVQEQQHLLRALRQVQDSASASSEDLISQLMRAMSMMRVHQKYFDAAQLKLLAGRRDALGEEALRASETAWPLLIQEVQAAMAAGVDPASPQVLALARRWQDLTRQFVGEDAGIQSKVREMYAKEPELQRSTGVTPALLAFLRQALLQPSPASAP